MLLVIRCHLVFNVDIALHNHFTATHNSDAYSLL